MSKVESVAAGLEAGRPRFPRRGERTRGFIHKFIRMTLRNPFRSIGSMLLHYYEEKERGVTRFAARS
jgi:hypothetical protein